MASSAIRDKNNLETWPRDASSCRSPSLPVRRKAIMNFRSQIRTIIKHVVCAECWLSSATDKALARCCLFFFSLSLLFSFFFSSRKRPTKNFLGWKIYGRTSDWQIYWRENMEAKGTRRRWAHSRMANYFCSFTNHVSRTVNTSFLLSALIKSIWSSFGTITNHICWWSSTGRR